MLTSINLTIHLNAFFLRRGPQVWPDSQSGPWHKKR